jgi:hypothetical protein
MILLKVEENAYFVWQKNLIDCALGAHLKFRTTPIFFETPQRTCSLVEDAVSHRGGARVVVLGKKQSNRKSARPYKQHVKLCVPVRIRRPAGGGL